MCAINNSIHDLTKLMLIKVLYFLLFNLFFSNRHTIFSYTSMSFGSEKKMEGLRLKFTTYS